ncbi:MAG: response regulator transcription factor [bacterium]|nr:response regulator transcription factor [bacterium]
MRLAIVEDDLCLLESMKLILGGEGYWKVVGAFSSAEEMLEKLDATSPDLMLVDIKLPGISGVELIKKIKAAKPLIDIVVFSGFTDRTTVFSALKAGACGFIRKGSSPREIIEELQTLSYGGAPMSPEIVRLLVNNIQESYTDVSDFLSKREGEILKGVDEGLSYSEIGNKLCISPHTVHSHIKNIYGKLEASSRKDAILKARRKGII